MPLLQIDTTVRMSSDEKTELAEALRERYSEIMDTGTDHVAVAIRPREPAELSLGRETADDRLFVLDADIREGRGFESKRAFVLAVMEFVASEHGVPEPNMKAVITEHEGPQMMGYDRVGSEWTPAEGSDEA
jgi:phenylpyruvate tautomerase PptA (4-oxalocrotonate tautomerase family)